MYIFFSLGENKSNILISLGKQVEIEILTEDS